jgi:aminoglycoside phosphotransferase
MAHRIGGALAWPWSRYREHRAAHDVVRLVPTAIAASWPAGGIPPDRIGPARITGSGVIVPLMDSREPRRWLVKFAASDASRRALERSVSNIAALREVPTLSGWTRLIPEVAGSGVTDGYSYVVESVLPGKVAGHAEQSRLPWSAEHPIVAAISELHDCTRSSLAVDDELLVRWIDARAEAVGRGRVGGRLAGQIARVTEQLRADLEGREVSGGWIHGDYWSGNVLVAADGEVTGIVDWESAAAEELALHDLLHIALYTRRAIEHVHLGRVIRGALDAALRADEEVLLELAMRSTGGIDRRATILLYWLRQVEMNLRRHPELAGDETWQRENVGRVLDGV